MNGTLKVSKYLFGDAIRAVAIFYTILIMVFIFFASLIGINIRQGGSISVSGLGFSTVIFLFVTGLNCFKTNFKFMQSNNISRKRFYFANIINLVSLSLFMAAVEVAINNTLKHRMPYIGMFEQLYKNDFFFADFLWSFAFYIFAISLGWFITMIYYRSNKFMKTIISLSPIFIVILLNVISNLTKGAFASVIINFLYRAFGFTNNVNPYIAVMNFLIATIGLFVLCYLLIRKAPIND